MRKLAISESVRSHTFDELHDNILYVFSCTCKHLSPNSCSQRKEQLLKGVDKYRQDHPGSKPELVLETPYMSKEVSNWSSTDQEEHTAQYKEIAEKTGKSFDNLCTGDAKVLEHHSPAWHSEEISDLPNATIRNVYLCMAAYGDIAGAQEEPKSCLAKDRTYSVSWHTAD